MSAPETSVKNAPKEAPTGKWRDLSGRFSRPDLRADLARFTRVATPLWRGNLAWIAAALAISFSGAYPIYQTSWYGAVILIGVVAGGILAALALARRWSVGKTAGIAALTYLVVGVPVASPGIFSAPGTFLSRLVGVLVAPVAGWRQILSLDLPLGTYHQVLAPFFFLALASSLISFSFAWRRFGPWWIGAPLAYVPLIVGIACGPSGVLMPGVSGGWGRALLGVALTLVLFGWLFWRPFAQRHLNIRIAHDLFGEEVRGQWQTWRMVRTGLGVGMMIAALLVSATFTPSLLEGKSRHVLRDDVTPEEVVAAQPSPLLNYRAFFTDDLATSELFRVEAPSDATRIRLATLTVYDGNTFTPAADQGADLFVRVPHFIPPSETEDGETSEPFSSTIDIAAYRGVWVPLPGSLGSVRFEGSDRDALTDGFFYNRETSTGVQIAEPGLESGTTYKVEAVDTLKPASALAGFTPASEHSPLVATYPDSLTEWVDAQELGDSGADLATLLQRLQERGYLSHALTIDPDAPPAWMENLGDYTFAPSRSGHSLDRVERLFDQMLTQQKAAGVDADPHLLVSAIGDDEQFAVAAALIADSLGYRARVVLGARLQPESDAETRSDPLPFCVNGSCVGADMAVWVEIQDGTTGEWAAVDVTPQYAMSPAPKIRQQSDPQHSTRVTPPSVTVQPPPAAKPGGAEAQADTETEGGHVPFEVPFAARIVGIVALVIVIAALPALTILSMKRIRTRRRQNAPTGISQIRGAWDEYCDYATDFGYSRRPGATRRETVADLKVESGSAALVAHAADYVSFQAPQSEDFDSAPIWEQVRAAKKELAGGTGQWERIRARFSPRSLR